MSIRDQFEVIDTVRIDEYDGRKLDYMDIAIGIRHNVNNGSYYSMNPFRFRYSNATLDIFNENHSLTLYEPSFFKEDEFPLDDPVVAATITYYILKVETDG